MKTYILLTEDDKRFITDGTENFYCDQTFDDQDDFTEYPENEIQLIEGFDALYARLKYNT